MPNNQHFVGLFPAGGQAKRLKIKSSKEVIPVLNENGGWQPVGQFLLDAYHAANIKTVHIILREEKRDIKRVFSDGHALGLDINYLNLNCFFGTPYTLDAAWPLIHKENIALGFPDIIFEPSNTFQLLKTQLLDTCADVVLGLFPTDRTAKSDMVEINSDGSIKYLHIKPSQTNLTHTWVAAVWRPSFSLYMHEYLASQRPLFEEDSSRAEPFVGTVFNAALRDKLTINGLVIPNGRILDIGTPNDLNIATSHGFFDQT